MAYDGSVKFDTSIDTKGFTSGISKIKSLAGGMVSAVGTAVTAVSGGLVAAGTAAAKVGMDFKAAMSKVSAISGATGDDLQALTDKAKELGASTKFSATESAEAFQYMAMAGWDTQSMLDGIDGIMNLSAADGLDLATTSDIVTDALTAFGLSAKDSTHFADVLATASSSANTNVSMLGESFKYVAPLAGAMKYSVEDVSLALGLMANASVKGSMAGTSLKTALSNLAAPTKNMQVIMDKLGISITDSDGEALSLRDIIVQLRDKFSDLSETEQSAAASTLFGKDAMSGMLAIINASDEDFNKLTESINNADGTAQKMAETLNDNLSGDITIMKSALEGLGITISESMNDKLREAVKTGTECIDRLSKAFTDGGLQGAVEEAGAIFGDLAVKIAGYAPEMLDAAVAFLKSFAKGLIDNKDKLIKAVTEIFKGVKDTLLNILPDYIKAPVEKIIGETENVIGNVVKVFKNVFTSSAIKKAVEFTVGVIETLVEVLSNIINSILPAVESGFKDIQKALSSTGFKNAIKTIKDIFKGLGDVISNIAKTYIPMFTTAISFIIENLDVLIPLVSSVVGGFAAFKIVQSVVSWCEGLAKTIQDLAKKFTDYMAQLTAAKTATAQAEGTTKLFNTTLSANPAIMVVTIIGTLVSALLVLGTYLVTSTGKTKELWDATDRLKEQEEKTAESAEKLGEKLGSVGEYAKTFRDEIDKAKSSLDGIDDSTITDVDKMSELKTNLEETQKQFNEIAGKYSDGRKKMTDDEVKSLEELFEKMRELSSQELELVQDYQDAAQTQANTWVETFVGNADEYAEASTSYIKAAEETKDKVIEAASSQYQTEVLNINKMTGLTEEQRKEKLKQAQQTYDDAVNAAKKECADTLAVIQKGYKDRCNIDVGFLDDTTDFYQQYLNIVKNHTNNVSSISQANANDQKALQIELQEEYTKYSKAMQELYDDFDENFDDSEAEYLGTWLEMVKATTENGENIDEETAAMVEFFLIALDKLPPESKEKMQSTIDGLQEVADNLPPKMKTKAENAANEYANGVGSTPAYQKCKNNAERLHDITIKGLDKNGLYNESYDIGSYAVEGMTDGMKSQMGTVFNVVESLGFKIPDVFRKKLGIASPSKVMKKLFGYVIEGGVLGLTENQDKLLKAADSISSDTINALSGRLDESVIGARVQLQADTGGFIGGLKNKFANAGLIAQLKAAAVAESSIISMSMAGKGYNNVSDSGMPETVKASGNIQAHISIDGREFAVATVPYIDEEMAFKS